MELKKEDKMERYVSVDYMDEGPTKLFHYAVEDLDTGHVIAWFKNIGKCNEYMDFLNKQRGVVYG